LIVLALALQQDDTHRMEAVSVALIVHEWEDVYWASLWAKHFCFFISL